MTKDKFGNILEVGDTVTLDEALGVFTQNTGTVSVLVNPGDKRTTLRVDGRDVVVDSNQITKVVTEAGRAQAFASEYGSPVGLQSRIIDANESDEERKARLKQSNTSDSHEGN